MVKKFADLYRLFIIGVLIDFLFGFGFGGIIVELFAVLDGISVEIFALLDGIIVRIFAVLDGDVPRMVSFWGTPSVLLTGFFGLGGILVELFAVLDGESLRRGPHHVIIELRPPLKNFQTFFN